MIRWNGCLLQTPNNTITIILNIFHDFIMILLLSTLILVFLTLLTSMYFKNLSNYFTENEELENLWTLGPFFLLIGIIYPSLRCLFIIESNFFCSLSVRVTAHQWYWSYNYLNFFDWRFDSYISRRNFLRLLDVDNRLTLPSNLRVRCFITSRDVLHSWALPSLGLKSDAIPGRISQVIVHRNRTGVILGQCSEICGAYHSFIPIVLEFIDFKDYIKLNI